jgi:hypothetical protein
VLQKKSQLLLTTILLTIYIVNSDRGFFSVGFTRPSLDEPPASHEGFPLFGQFKSSSKGFAARSRPGRVRMPGETDTSLPPFRIPVLEP